MKKTPREWAQLGGIVFFFKGYFKYKNLGHRPMKLSEFWDQFVERRIFNSSCYSKFRRFVFKNLDPVDKSRAGFDRFFCE